MCQTALKLVSQVPLVFWVGDEMVASPYLTTMVWLDDAGDGVQRRDLDPGDHVSGGGGVALDLVVERAGRWSVARRGVGAQEGDVVAVRVLDVPAVRDRPQIRAGDVEEQRVVRQRGRRARIADARAVQRDVHAVAVRRLHARAGHQRHRQDQPGHGAPEPAGQGATAPARAASRCGQECPQTQPDRCRCGGCVSAGRAVAAAAGRSAGRRPVAACVGRGRIGPCVDCVRVRNRRVDCPRVG